MQSKCTEEVNNMAVDITIQRQVAWLEGQLTTLARLSEQQRLFDEVDKIKKQLESFAQAIDQKVGPHDVVKHASSVCSNVSDGIKNAISLCDQNHADLSHLFAVQKEHAARFEDVTACLTSFKRDLENLLHEISGKSFKEEVDLVDKALRDQISLVKTKSDFNEGRLSDRLASLEQKHINVADAVDKLDDSFYKSIREFERSTQQHQSILQNVKAFFDGSLSDLSKKFDQKLAALPKPSEFSPEKLKAELEAKYEQMVTDAKNASLRASNAELKIAVLEKKLEQAFLLIENQKLS